MDLPRPGAETIFSLYRGEKFSALGHGESTFGSTAPGFSAPDFGVFAVGAKPPILEFLRIVRRTSYFGILNIITSIFKTTQNLRFWSFCGGRKTSDFGVFAYSTQTLRFWSIKYYESYF